MVQLVSDGFQVFGEVPYCLPDELFHLGIQLIKRHHLRGKLEFRILLSAVAPAFRQLVEGEIAREDIEAQLQSLQEDLSTATKKRRITVSSNGVSFSNMIGNSACNRKYFETRYPDLSIRFTVDDNLPDMTFEVSES